MGPTSGVHCIGVNCDVFSGNPRVGHQRAPRVEAEGGGLRVQLLRGVPAPGLRGEAQIAQDSARGHV